MTATASMTSISNSSGSVAGWASHGDWRYTRRSARSAGFTALPRRRLLVGDAAATLRLLPAASVDCCVTSPPYFQLRDYGVDGQLGREPRIDDWVSNLRAVIRQVGRVLKPTGSLWLNLGDAYSRAERYGAPAKSLLLGPERLLLALAADGWLVRNKVVWAKPNPLPHSVRDRLNTTYEVVYFLTRGRSYYFALDDIRQPYQARRRSATRRRPSTPAPPGRARWPAATAVCCGPTAPAGPVTRSARTPETSGPWRPPATAGRTSRRSRRRSLSARWRRPVRSASAGPAANRVVGSQG